MKKQAHKIIFLGCAALAVLVLSVLPVLAKQNANAQGPRASIVKGEVERGEIVTKIKGGGALTQGKSTEITVPQDVKLTGFLVNNGDIVTKGQPIAQVDPVTTLAAIAKTQSELDGLARQLDSIGSDASEYFLSAEAGGIVKEVFGQPGQSVEDVMLEHGALAVVSIKGRMAVSVETEARLPVGSAVNVVFSDGTAVAAMVDSNLEGTLRISFEDRNCAEGELVRVTDESGVELGTGLTEIQTPFRILGYAGTVKEVTAVRGEWVDAGDVIMKLTDTGESLQYNLLISERQTQEERLRMLIQLYHAEVVCAPCDGMISGIDENSQGTGDRIPQSTEMKEQSTVTIAAVTPCDTITVQIMVDERDVLLLREGMDAVVNIPAVSEVGIRGRIDSVGTSGVNHGGSSKFPVKIQIAQGDKMLTGMTATVEITLGSAGDILTVPVSSLVDDGDQTVIYTGYDEKKDCLINPVAVVTGSSDGERVQLQSGLEAGDSFYYSFYDTLELSDQPDFGIFPFAAQKRK